MWLLGVPPSPHVIEKVSLRLLPRAVVAAASVTFEKPPASLLFFLQLLLLQDLCIYRSHYVSLLYSYIIFLTIYISVRELTSSRKLKQVYP